MSTTINLQYVQPHDGRSPQVDHYADLACAVVRAADDHGNVVTLFFTARTEAHELDAAEQWLREALEAVLDAKIDRAAKVPPAPCACGDCNAQANSDTLANNPLARIGEPLDLTAVDL